MRRTAIAGKALADIGLVHHAEHRRALVQQRDQGAPDWKSRDEGFGAVYRIQHPDIFGVLALVAELLADDAVLGKIALDQAAHHRFRGAVGLGDRIEIARALVVDGERGPEERQDGFTRRSREAADEGCEIDDRHGCPLPPMEEEYRLLPSPIRTVAHRQRRVIPVRIANWLSNRLSKRLRLSVDFWLALPSRSCEFWPTSTAVGPGLAP